MTSVYVARDYWVKSLYKRALRKQCRGRTHKEPCLTDARRFSPARRYAHARSKSKSNPIKCLHSLSQGNVCRAVLCSLVAGLLGNQRGTDRVVARTGKTSLLHILNFIYKPPLPETTPAPDHRERVSAFILLRLWAEGRQGTSAGWESSPTGKSLRLQ